MSADPVETAWKIHAAIVDWTGKVDTKASFTLTIESALLGGVVALSGDGRVFHDLGGFSIVWYVLGVVTLMLSVLSVVAVVRPRLRKGGLKSEARENFVYFGHLRHLDAAAVQHHLETSDLLPVLSKQLVEMSKIAWTKHRLVQVSMSLAPLGVLFLVISSLVA
nr:Pycsar system effector family protein [Rhodococcus sp. 06-621-2]